MKSKLVLSFLFVIINISVYGQQMAYMDPAQAYNRLLIEKSGDSYMRIKNYKVIGSPYLFGQKIKGDLFAKGETASNIDLSYNTYNNEVEFFSKTNSNQPLIKEVQQVDSFTIYKNPSAGVNENLHFINGSFIYDDGKSFYQVIQKGKHYDLYKKYSGQLAVVSTNYIQSELRQFDLNYGYYYLDHKGKKLKKLKVSNAGMKKEFPGDNGISTLLQGDELQKNPEAVLKEIFSLINK